MEENGEVIGGFRFRNPEAYAAARKEAKAVGYLKTKIDFTKSDSILSAYQQVVHQNVFHTPVGLTFLASLQERLLKSDNVPNTLIDPIEGDPLKVSDLPPEEGTPEYEAKKRQIERDRKLRRQQEEDAKAAELGRIYRSKFHAAIAVIIVLVVAIAVMMVLALTSKSPTILDYRTKIENEYADWEERLNQREKLLKQQEQLAGFSSEMTEEPAEN